MKKDEVIYVENTKEFIVNNKTIKENTLSKKEQKKLLKEAKTKKLLLNNNTITGNVL